MITADTTARELEDALGSDRLTLYGQHGEWSAVVWREPLWGIGKGTTWWEAADKALKNLREKAKKP